MKVFQCDCCKKVIEDPYEVNFREYLLEAEYTSEFFLLRQKRKAVVDLCEVCYKNLHQVMKIKDSADVLSQFMEILKSKYLQHGLSEDYIAITVAELDTLFKLFRGLK